MKAGRPLYEPFRAVPRRSRREILGWLALFAALCGCAWLAAVIGAWR